MLGGNIGYLAASRNPSAGRERDSMAERRIAKAPGSFPATVSRRMACPSPGAASNFADLGFSGDGGTAFLGTSVSTFDSADLVAWRSIRGAAPFIFMSSLSSSFEAANQYGRIKFLAESMLSQQGDFILRPGTVIGEGNAGFYNLLKRTLATLSVFPVVRTPPWLHFSDIDELIAKVVGIAAGSIPPAAVSVSISARAVP